MHASITPLHELARRLDLDAHSLTLSGELWTLEFTRDNVLVSVSWINHPPRNRFSVSYGCLESGQMSHRVCGSFDAAYRNVRSLFP